MQLIRRTANKSFALFCFCIFYFFPAKSQNDFNRGKYPLSIIFDTDFGPDYDDVGAITEPL